MVAKDWEDAQGLTSPGLNLQPGWPPPKGRIVEQGGANSSNPSSTSSQPQEQNAGGLLPRVTLPKGGGAIRGIGEKFSVNPVTGTGALSIPLPLSPGRSGFTPQLNLSYDSGAGNGPFGFGWSISTPSITRKTDKGLPRYCDEDESDVFILSGAEDLVPIMDLTGRRVSSTRTVHGRTYTIFYYRPRTEGLFSRIERWVDTTTRLSHWRSLSRDNVITLYGCDPGSRIADPGDPGEIFSYRICRTWDNKGNVATYGYVPEDGTGVDFSQAHEANRTGAVRATQCYLKMICYGNLSSYFPTWAVDGTETPLPDKWLFQAVFDYGDHAQAAPTPTPNQPWSVRPDPFSVYRAAFEVRTYRRVQRILVFHNFQAENAVGKDCLVRSLDFVYSDQQAPVDPRNPIYTFLVSVTQTGYPRNGNPVRSRSLPPLEFEYSQPQIQPDVLTLDRDSLANLPEGLDGSRFQWVDLDGEGLSGILTDAAGTWGYKRNLSPINQVVQPDGSLVARARFGPLESVPVLPSQSTLGGGQHLMDLSGGGRLDVVDLSGLNPGFFKRTADEGWEPFQTFASLPDIDWNEPNLKFVDLTGDGIADVLITEDGLFTLYPSLGEAGFGPAEVVRTPWDEERGPKVVLADGTQTVFLADMSGDGLSDIVRVRNGEVCYWPNLGYGRFGSKVTMDGSPRFTDEERFDPRRIRLADIDGSGTTDLLYIGADGVHVCFNQSGNAWAAPTRIAVFPTTDTLSAVQVTDLLGTGTACLVWSSPLPDEGAAPLRYVDLMGGRKPHLMVLVRNNLGAETRLSYAPSTRFYLADETAGRPWVTRLPHVVHVVERQETFDWIGLNRMVTRYAYHHGYFDGYEREFRGFGMVEQWDTEEYRTDTGFAEGDALNWDSTSWSPPLRTRTWFHTGAFEEAIAVSQQYAREYWAEPGGAPAVLPDTVLPSGLDDGPGPPGLNPYEVREAYRSLKGQMLRTEVYADDGSVNAGNPYFVTEQNFTIRWLQPIGENLHAVFFVHPREKVSFHYERNAGDPRVTHDVTLEVDGFGNVRRSVSVGYPHRAGYPAPEPSLSANVQAMLAYDQARMHVRATEHQFTNAIADAVAWPDTYRLPLPSASITAELTGIAPQASLPGVTNLFGFEELDALWQNLWPGAHDIPYESIPSADVDGAGAPATVPTRRIIGQTSTLYRSDDLTTLLPSGQMEPLALPGESYHAALTPGLIAGVFGALVPTATLTEGQYMQLTGQSSWWMRSGRVFYSAGDTDTPAQELAAAYAHFFMARRAVDPFGAITRVDYDAYDLLPAMVTDAAGNVTAAANDYRALQPSLVTDPNGNRTAVAFDCFGLVAGTALMGKTTENVGDSLTGFLPDLDDLTIQTHLSLPLTDPGAILVNATTRIVYDPAAYFRTRAAAQPAPPVVYTLACETHASDLAAPAVTLYQHAFAYSDGFAREIQHKIRAPSPVVDGKPSTMPRWIGSGWTIFNNKGKPVRKYEPFFSVTNAFEFAAQTGVSSILFYDPAERVVATLHPDNTWEKVVFDCWRQQSWDANDTVLIGDPRADPDVGDYFLRLLGSAPNAFVSWHDQRIGGNYGVTADDQAAQKDAAQKAAAHAGTPAVAHFDALGRTCLKVEDNGAGGRYPSRVALDTEGKPLAVFDALGRHVMEYCLRVQQAAGLQYVAGTDMAGNPVYRNGMDGGARRSLVNVAGKPIRTWDALGHAFRMLYDLLQRPTHRYVSTNGAAEILIGRLVYGEGLAAANLCGRLFRHYDTAGVTISNLYDFKGNLLSSTRQLANNYQQSIDWTVLAGLTQAAALDAAAQPLLNQNESFDSSTMYDALNRPIQSVSPHSAVMKPNVTRPSYNESNLLDQVDVWQQQAASPTVLMDPASATVHALTAIVYNARGQRTSLALGNGTITTYTYDPATFRLTSLTTTRPGTFAGNQQMVQNLAYYYDPVGNVTRIRDTADTQNVIYFSNQRVEPSNDYTYDPLYRLTSASGREHLGQTAGALNPPVQVTNDDSPRTQSGPNAPLLNPGDGNAMGNYTESYVYDQVGNISSVQHQTIAGSWTRRYTYTEPSQITAAETNNRLSTTSLPGDPVAGPYSATYGYDAHGNMLRMPHLPALTWDEEDHLRSSTRQVINNGTPVMTFYVYDAAGHRIRKTTNSQAQTGQTAIRTNERVYLGEIELYREFAADGVTATLQRETLHIEAGQQVIALVETRTVGVDRGLAQLTRYQHTSHLGSAVLELDDTAQIICYEEYFPYGSTSYQAVRNQTDTPKRYRYTGKERDEENDLYYHGARYYAPWLGRWTACDPAGMVDGPNIYAYVRNNPARLRDRSGRRASGENGEKIRWVVPRSVQTAEQFQKWAQQKGIHYKGNVTVTHTQHGGRSVPVFHANAKLPEPGTGATQRGGGGGNSSRPADLGPKPPATPAPQATTDTTGAEKAGAFAEGVVEGFAKGVVGAAAVGVVAGLTGVAVSTIGLALLPFAIYGIASNWKNISATAGRILEGKGTAKDLKAAGEAVGGILSIPFAGPASELGEAGGQAVRSALSTAAESLNAPASSAIQAQSLARQLTSEEQAGQILQGDGHPLIGAGTGRPLQAADRLAQDYGGAPEDWVKVGSDSSAAHGVQTPAGKNFEIHAYQNVKTGQVVEMKTKVGGH